MALLNNLPPAVQAYFQAWTTGDASVFRPHVAPRFLAWVDCLNDRRAWRRAPGRARNIAAALDLIGSTAEFADNQEVEVTHAWTDRRPVNGVNCTLEAKVRWRWREQHQRDFWERDTFEGSDQYLFEIRDDRVTDVRNLT